MNPYQSPADRLGLAIHARLLRAVMSAVRKLNEIAQGANCNNDHQLRACIALVRLAPHLIDEIASKPPPRSLVHPSLSHEQRLECLRILEGGTSEEGS